MDPKDAQKLQRSTRKFNKADEALRTDKETPVEELAENYLKAKNSHQKLIDKIESA